MTGGTYLVIRRIQLALDDWDRQSVDAQEQIIGRRKISGAPLGGSHEFDPMNLHAKRTDGAPVIPTDAHVRLASAQENWGYTMFGRGYAYTDGLTATATDAAGETPLRAGLLFSAYQRSPRLTFIPIFEKLAGQDSLSRFTTHTASAIMALPRPPGGRVPRWVSSYSTRWPRLGDNRRRADDHRPQRLPGLGQWPGAIHWKFPIITGSVARSASAPRRSRPPSPGDARAVRMRMAVVFSRAVGAGKGRLVRQRPGTDFLTESRRRVEHLVGQSEAECPVR